MNEKLIQELRKHRASRLMDFIYEKNTQGEVYGFIAGYDAALEQLKLLGIANVVATEGKCSGCDESTGETKLWCCNHCGLRTEDF